MFTVFKTSVLKESEMINMETRHVVIYIQQTNQGIIQVFSKQELSA